MNTYQHESDSVAFIHYWSACIKKSKDEFLHMWIGDLRKPINALELCWRLLRNNFQIFLTALARDLYIT